MALINESEVSDHKVNNPSGNNVTNSEYKAIDQLYNKHVNIKTSRSGLFSNNYNSLHKAAPKVHPLQQNPVGFDPRTNTKVKEVCKKTLIREEKTFLSHCILVTYSMNTL